MSKLDRNQEESPAPINPALTRRGAMNTLIGTAAAATGVAAAMALPTAAVAAAGTDAALFSLSKQLDAAQRRSDRMCKPHTRAERAMLDWKHDNPEPAMRDYEIGTDQEAVEYIRQLMEFDGDASRVTVPDPYADLKAASAEHSAARAQWEASEKTARADTGFDDAEANWDAANDEVLRLLEEITECRPHSLDGLRLKARAAADHQWEPLAWAIVEDVLAMAAA